MGEHLKIAEGIATVAIAIYVAFVGTFQWITAREKLRLDLYDRRFDVYARTVEFMQSLMFWTDVAIADRIPSEWRSSVPFASRDSYLPVIHAS